MGVLTDEMKQQRLGFVATVCADARCSTPRRIRAIVVVRVDQAGSLISPGYDRDTDEASVRAHWIRYYLGSAP